MTSLFPCGKREGKKGGVYKASLSLTIDPYTLKLHTNISMLNLLIMYFIEYVLWSNFAWRSNQYRFDTLDLWELINTWFYIYRQVSVKVRSVVCILIQITDCTCICTIHYERYTWCIVKVHYIMINVLFSIPDVLQWLCLYLNTCNCGLILKGNCFCIMYCMYKNSIE